MHFLYISSNVPWDFSYVKAEICQQCSLDRWWAPEHLLVSHTVLAGHLELASDFQFHICIKKAVSLRSSADKISKNDSWFVVFYFSVPLISGCLSLGRLKSISLLPSMIIRLFILCLSWDTEMQRHPKSLTTFLLNYFLIQPHLHKLLSELPDMLQRCLWGEAVPGNHNEDPTRQSASERNLGSQSVWKLLVWWRHTMRQPLKYSSAAHICDSRAIVNSTYLLNYTSRHVHSDS